jgi:ABC-2 type transport system permease protein
MPDPKGFLRRLGAIITKVVRQLGRDRLTFAMMFGVPIMQLLLFGYAIDTDPHRLPTAVVAARGGRGGGSARGGGGGCRG